MKSLKNHLSVILPLFVLLFAVQFTIMTQKIVTNYAEKLTKEYSIVIVAPKPLDIEEFKGKIKGIREIIEISSKSVLDRLKGSISSQNLSLLQIALPKFYSITLTSFPNIQEVENIKERLLKSGLVNKVETFSKTHTKVYKMLIILQNISLVFLVFIFVVSLLLMFKQMRIWLLEHQETIAVMTLFGAPFWMKSALLYRLAIVGSIISALIVCAIFLYLPQNKIFSDLANSLDIVLPKFDALRDTGYLMGGALLFSCLIVSLVIRKINKQ